MHIRYSNVCFDAYQPRQSSFGTGAASEIRETDSLFSFRFLLADAREYANINYMSSTGRLQIAL